MSLPEMYYFGPWSSPGHYLFHEDGNSAHRHEAELPWTSGDFDARLQPHSLPCQKRGSQYCSGRCIGQGVAIVHHKDGWTALCFWDSSVDKRAGCNSSYIAKGTYNFGEMVSMAKTRFAERWNRNRFEVTLWE